MATAVEDKRSLWYLRKIPLLAELPADVLDKLAERVEFKEVARRSVFYLPGDPGKSVFFVNGGRVKVSKVTRDGKQLALAYRAPGDIFGELCLIDGGPREDMAEALDNSLITEVEAEYFGQLLRVHSKLSYQMVRLLAERRRDLENKIEKLVFRDVHAKLAELLINLSAEYGVEGEAGTLVALKITHQEMANLIGSTRETVSLTLSEFRRQGLIKFEGRRVIIADHEGLRALA